MPRAVPDRAISQSQSHPRYRWSFARQFWQGCTIPHPKVTAAAVGLAIMGWLVVAASSTEAHVRRTPAEKWMGNRWDDYSRITALAIQGAVEHAPADRATIVFVGPSILREILPTEAESTDLFTRVTGRPTKVMKLCADQLGLAGTAGIIDRFGANPGVTFVVGVNRHGLGREPSRTSDATLFSELPWGIASSVLLEEMANEGIPPPRLTGIALLDYPRFFRQSFATWRWWGRTPIPYFEHRAFAPKFTDQELVSKLPLTETRHLEKSLALLSRLAARIRGAGGHIVILDVPWADITAPAVQNEHWRLEESEYRKRRAAWIAETKVSWVDPAPEANLNRRDFSDPRHVADNSARFRFATALARQWTRLAL